MDDESELQKTARQLALGTKAFNRLRGMSGATELARAAALLESPATRMIKDLENSPAFRLQKQLENDPVFRMQKELAALNQSNLTFAMDNGVFDQLEAFKKQQALYGAELDFAKRMLPPPSLLQDAARQIAAVVSPPASILHDVAWNSRLATVMSGLHRPWVSVENSALSFKGLGVLTRLSDTARLAQPYHPDARELFDDALGDAVEIDPEGDEEDADAVHLEAGMDAGLVTLSPPETGEIFKLAGFKLVMPFAPLPVPLDDPGTDLTHDPSHAALVAQIEIRLRAYINQRMSDAFGQDWIKARVASETQKKWKLKQVSAVDSGEPKFELLHYSDLIELKDIIIGKKTWGPIFSETFGVREHFITGMDRLYGVRKPLAHSRPISNGQQIHLYTEGVALLRALGVNILAN